jgi:hypothetical protein
VSGTKRNHLTAIAAAFEHATLILIKARISGHREMTVPHSN